MKGVHLGVTCSHLCLINLFLEWWDGRFDGGRQEICERLRKESRGERREPEARHYLETEGRSSARGAQKRSRGLAMAPDARG